MRSAPLTPGPARHRTRPAVALLLVAGLTVAGWTGARPGEAEGTPAAPAAVELALAPPSPDLPGLPPVSLELASVPVEGAAVRQARAAYDQVDRALAGAQAHRADIDRSLAGAQAQRRHLTAELAAAQARAASSRARLDEVTTAIGELGVGLFVTGGATARLDAALTDEQPSINDQDRQEVLGSAALDVLLVERTAYQARLAEAQGRVDAARGALEALASDEASVAAARPAAVDAEVGAAPAVAAKRVGYESTRVLATVAKADFPLVALDAYHRAARWIAFEEPGCAVQWWALAGISRVEGRHGTYGGSTLDVRGDTTRHIIGIQLNGTNQTQVVPDTDGGALDGDPAYDRAVGPMQFIPGTWSRFAADGNGDAVASPFNLYDAALAAARYLCGASHGLADDPGLRQAYFSYNHSEAYVETVLGWARLYQERVEIPSLDRS
jgi:membrane-bound lytic murein transglycosylase B